MRDETQRRLALAFFAVTAVLLVGGVVWEALEAASGTNVTVGRALGDSFFAVLLSAFPAVGVVVARRQPRNWIAWLFLLIGFLGGLGNVLNSYAWTGLNVRPPLPGAAAAGVIASAMWVPVIGLIGTFLLLLFPNGRLPSPRWKGVAWFTGVTLVSLTVLFTVFPGSLKDIGLPDVPNPLGIEALRGKEGLISLVLLIPACMVACAVGLVVRFRRSRGEERLQLKWLTTAGAMIAAVYLTGMLVSLPYTLRSAPEPLWLTVLANVSVVSFILIPTAAAFAILRYRLYDIDVVINKALVFGALAAFITLVYVAVVVGVGSLVGSRGKPNVALSVLATSLVAVAFQPVRERIQRFANRLVYGQRASPYEVLTQFAQRAAETYATDDVLARMARVVGEGTASAATVVWLRVENDLVPAAGWPESEHAESRTLGPNDELPPFDDTDRVVPVVDQGRLLGALSIRKPRGESLTPAEEKLLNDLAAQAGLVLRNVQLTSELRARLDQISTQADELRASRQRIVAAQDAERRRLERNIHDGAQQHLVALAVKLRLAKSLATSDRQRAKKLLRELEGQTDETLETLRELARGIYPPLLAREGLTAALTAQARKTPMDVRVDGDGVERFPEDVEAAVYFCSLEALQNVAKYAKATTATVRLRSDDGYLLFEIEDDGVGFDPAATRPGSGLQNMADRLAALGGSLDVRSELGRGTTIRGRVPTRDAERVG